MGHLGVVGVANIDGAAIHVQVVGESDQGRLIVEEVGMDRRHIVGIGNFVQALLPDPLARPVREAAESLRPFIEKRADLGQAIATATERADDEGLLTQHDFQEITSSMSDSDRYSFSSALIEQGIHVRTGAVDILTDPHENPDGLSKRTDEVQGPGAEGEARGRGEDAQDAPAAYPWTPADSGDGISNPGAESEHDFPWPRKVEGEDESDIEEREAEFGWSGTELVDERWASLSMAELGLARVGMGMTDLLRSPRKRPKSPLEEKDKSTEGAGKMVDKHSDLNTPSGRDRALNPSVHEERNDAYQSFNQWEDPDLHLGRRQAQQPYEQGVPLAEDESPFDKDDPAGHNIQPTAGFVSVVSMREIIAQGVDNRLSDPNVHTDVDEQRGDRGIPRPPEDEDVRYAGISPFWDEWQLIETTAELDTLFEIGEVDSLTDEQKSKLRQAADLIKQVLQSIEL